MAWLPQAYDTGFSVTFAEGLDARSLLLRLGCEEESIDRIDEDDALDRQLTEGIVMIRGGEHDGWDFAVQRWTAQALQPGVLEAVSAGTRAFVVKTETIPWFSYCEDTEPACGFDPGAPSRRHGSTPEWLLTAMAEVGLDPSPDPSPDAPPPTGVAGMLLLAEKAFGVDLPYEAVFSGELLGGIVPD
ncbi:DUF6461 domain-containing protein [Kitasatospora arboriphila]